MRYRAALIACVLVMAGATLAQQPDRPQLEPIPPSTLVVQVRAMDGTPLNGFAQVRLFSMFGSVNRNTTTIDGGRATFPNVPVGEYRLEVTAAGYEKMEEDAQVLASGGTAYVMINLRPEGSPAPARPSGPPLLAPKARRALEKGAALLEANDPVGARPYLEQAYKLAPNFPEIPYMLGVAYLRLSRPAEARTMLEKVISLAPNHVAAMNSLSAVLIVESQNDKALEILSRALAIEPNSWKTHWILATLRARMREMPAALEHVDKAIELSAGAQPQMYVLRGQLLEALGKSPEAIAQWEQFLSTYPERQEVADVRQRLEKLQAQKAAANAKAVAATAPPEVPATAPLAVVNEEARTINVKWAPPDIDEISPQVEPGVACPLPEVLKSARRRATSLVETLQSFTATETIQRQIMDADIAAFAEWTFEYQVQIEQPMPGRLAVSDFRVAKVGSGDPNMRNNGIPAMALIMHPFYADDFEMRCEGRATLAGQPAWLVYFRQRDDRQPRIRSYGVQGRRYPARLKGRAWISMNSGNVMRLETDLVKPIPEMRLTRDHMVIDYAPVKFQKRNVLVWLPSTVNFYTDVDVKRRHYLHLYDDFMLFAVDTKYEIEKKEAPSERPPE